MGITLEFTRAVDPDSILVGNSVVVADESGQALGVEDFAAEAVSVSETGRVVTLNLSTPLRLLETYVVSFDDGTDLIQSSSGGVLQGASSSERRITTREGELKNEVLVSFLQPIGGIQFMEDLSTAVVIEGIDADSDGNAVTTIGITSAQPGESFGIPAIIEVTEKETNQNGLTFTPDESVWNISWTEGDFDCSGDSDCYISQSSDRGLTWTNVQLDASIGNNDNAFGWSPQVQHIEREIDSQEGEGSESLNETFVMWWMWEDRDPETALFSDCPASTQSSSALDTFRIYYDVQESGNFGAANPKEVATPAGSQFSWPYTAVSPDNRAVYAVWGEASSTCEIAQSDGANVPSWERYWLGQYRDGVWNATPIDMSADPFGGNVGRHIGFYVTNSGRGVILGRQNERVDAYLIDLESATLINRDRFSELDFLPRGDGFTPPTSCTVKFKQNTAKFRAPRAVLSEPAEEDSNLIVGWFGRSSGVPGVIISGIDTETGEWLPAEEIEPEDAARKLDEDPRGPAIRVDSKGIVTVIWSVRLAADANFTEAAYVAGRRRVPVELGGDGSFEPLECALTNDAAQCVPGDPTLSEPFNCAFASNVALHSSGRLIIGWNEISCGAQGVATLASVFRKFE